MTDETGTPPPKPGTPEGDALVARVEAATKAAADRMKEPPFKKWFDGVFRLVFVAILEGGLESLRHYIEDPGEPEVTWQSPWTELHFPVEWDWTEGGILRRAPAPPAPLVEAFRKGEDLKKLEEGVVMYGASTIVDLAPAEVLHGLTNRMAVHIKGGKTVGALVTDPKLAKELDALTAEERDARFDALSEPFIIGGLTVEDEAGEPYILAPLDHLGEEPGTTLVGAEAIEENAQTFPSLFFTGEAAGVPFKGSVVIIIYPLTVNEDKREAYFPILTGLVFAPVGDAGEGEEQPTVDPSTWPAEDRTKLWKALLEDLPEKLRKELWKDEGTPETAAPEGVSPLVAETPEPEAPLPTTLVPAGAPPPERRKTAGVAFGHTLASSQAMTIVRDAHKVHLPRKWSIIPRWEKLVEDEVRDLRGEEGDRAFEDLRKATGDPDERGPLLRKVRRAGGKEEVVLTDEAQDRLRRRAGLGRGYLAVDRYGQERLYKLFEVKGGGFLEVGLSWQGLAGPLVDEWRATFKRKAEELARDLETPSLFEELDEEKKARVDKLLAQVIRWEDGRRIMEAILGQVGKQHRNPVEIPAEAFRVLLWPKRTRAGSWPKNWKQRVDDALTALHALTFSFRTYRMEGVKGYGSMLGQWVYKGLGPGDHGDGVYRIDVSSGFIGCLEVFQSGKQRLRSGVEAVSFHFARDLTQEERKALGWGKGQKAEDTFVTFDAGRAFYSAAAGLTPTQENLVHFIESGVTLKGDTARPENKAAQVSRRAGDAKEPRPYTAAFCPLLPEELVFHGALGHFKKNPEAGFTLAGGESRAARHPGGLLHHMGHALPPGAARTQRAEVITRGLEDLKAVVVDYLGGVVVGHDGTRWLPFENFRDLNERTLTRKLRLYIFLPEDWEAKRRTKWEDVTGRRVTEDPEEAERETWEAEDAGGDLGHEVASSADGFRGWPLPRRLRAMMRRRGLRQTDLAVMFEVSPPVITYWLGGKNPIPPDVDPLLVRWVENGTPPTAEELAALAARRSKRPGRKKTR